jgi:hypothetical protein
MLATPARSEGSRDMYPASYTGSRANLEWTTKLYGGPPQTIPRRSLLKVYAQAGETILVGASSIGVGQGDILIFDPLR